MHGFKLCAWCPAYDSAVSQILGQSPEVMSGMVRRPVLVWTSELSDVSPSLCRLPLDLPEAQRVLMLQLMLKIADLGHLSHPHEVHKVLILVLAKLCSICCGVFTAAAMD